MSSLKERHYWSQLRAALTAGQWRNNLPAKAYNGSLISWSELFRKFKKHCRGFEDVAVIAEQTRLLALLLGSKYKDDDEDVEIDNPSGSAGTEREGSGSSKAGLGRLDLEGDCLLLPEQLEEAEVGYEMLKALPSSKFDTKYLALAYYAYALGNPRDCLEHLGRISELLQFQNHIPNDDSTRSNGLLAPSTYAPSSTTSFSGSFASTPEFTVAEVRDGRAWAIAETFRSLCLRGMSQELLHPTDLHIALREYNTALPLFSVLRSEFAPKNLLIASSSTGNPEFALFVQLRELWRWVERLLWRAIVLSAKICDIFVDQSADAAPSTTKSVSIESIWVWFGHYTNCSALWPALFRTRHRSTICVLYLRALVLRFGTLASFPTPGTAPVYLPPKKSPSATTSTATTRPPTAQSHTAPTTASVSPAFFQSPAPTPSTWMSIARSVVQDYRAILNSSTSFPRAGERNLQVEDFVELCVKVWETGGAIGEQVGWVIEILNWAQRLTFNSSLVLRHLTRLLYIGSAPYLAKRTLYVYIQVVGKAWEASKLGVGEDQDDDVRWVETLVFGARMLCAGVGGPGFLPSLPTENGLEQGILINDDGNDGIDEVLEASGILEKARWRLDENDKRLLGEVLLAEGIVWSLRGIKGQDPLSRSADFDKAHTCLLHSIQAHATPSAYYHLALSFARRIPSIHGAKAESIGKQEAHEHNMTKAIECAGQAIEGSSNDVRYWHLLGLLLSATEKWVAAKEILDRGALLDDADDTTGAEDAGKDGEDTLSHVYGNNALSRVGSEDAETVTQLRMESHSLVAPNGISNSTTGEPSTLPKSYRTTTNGTVMPRQMSNSSRPSGDSFDTTSGVILLPLDATSLPSSSSFGHASALHIYSPSLNNSNEPHSLLPSLTIDQYPPSTADLFERHLQLRMTQVALMEVIGGPEGAEQSWLEVFSWVAEKRGVANGTNGSITPEANSQPRRSLDQADIDRLTDLGIADPQNDLHSESLASHDQDLKLEKAGNSASSKRLHLNLSKKTSKPDTNPLSPNTLAVPIGIKVSPATPELEPEVQRQLEKVERAQARSVDSLLVTGDFTGKIGEKEKEKSQSNGSGTTNREKRSLSIDRDSRGDTSKSKKVQQILKGSVHKGRAGITAVSKKIGHGVTRNGVLRRSTSNPDFYAALRPTSYQASSIHSRRRLSSIIHSEEGTLAESPPPPPPPSLPSTSTQQGYKSRSQRLAKENRLLSDLWLMSAATFRRLSKIDQAKGAIQEAEVRDENNPNVWVQLGLYYVALGMYQHAVDALQKARFISVNDVAATLHLARLYLDPEVTAKIHSSSEKDNSFTNPPPPPARVVSSASTTGSYFAKPSNVSPDVDLAAGMLAHLTKGRGWDVPEAWYFLAKAYGKQDRKDKERETLKIALEYSENRGVRDIGSALGWCL